MQTKNRTISILEDDRENPVAHSSDPGLVTIEQLLTRAREFKEEYPQLFKNDFDYERFSNKEILAPGVDIRNPEHRKMLIEKRGIGARIERTIRTINKLIERKMNDERE